jgi:hypothetical protein
MQKLFTLKTCLSILAVFFTLGTQAQQYDFKLGQLYYKIKDATAKTVSVVTEKETSPFYSVENYPTGAVVIPLSVNNPDDGENYLVTGIGDHAFDYCTNLTSVTIPSSVINIGEYAFLSCPQLTEITVDNSNGTYSSLDGLLFNKDKTTLIQYPIAKSTETYTLPNTLKTIEKYAFRACSNLTSVTIPNSVTSIGEYAFNSCSGLTSITIGNSVTSLPAYVFGNCTSLTSITIGSAINSISGNAFYASTGLSEFIVDGENSTYSSQDGVLFNKAKTKLVSFPSGKAVSTYTIPSSVTEIGSSAFKLCNGLTSVVIPSSVTTMGSEVFMNCTNLTSVSISNSLTVIPYGTFFGCAGLTSVTIPSSVTNIGTWAFRNCTGLRSINIPSSVTTIGGSAFNNCTNLASIFCEVVDPTTITSLGSSVFNAVPKGSATNACKFYVPKGSKVNYEAESVNDQWKEFLLHIYEMPSVATNAATATTINSATLNATINLGDEVAQITERGFEWRKSADSASEKAVSTTAENNFSAVLTDLETNTEYTFRAYIKIGGFRVYGENLTFTPSNFVVGVPEYTTANLKFYPNPVSDMLHIASDRAIEFLQIFDISGKLLEVKYINNAQTDLNTSDWESGLYFVCVKTSEGMNIHKILK